MKHLLKVRNKDHTKSFVLSPFCTKRMNESFPDFASFDTKPESFDNEVLCGVIRKYSHLKTNRFNGNRKDGFIRKGKLCGRSTFSYVVWFLSKALIIFTVFS